MKLLIRYGSTTQAETNKYQGLTEATDLFLGSVAQFETLAHQGGRIGAQLAILPTPPMRVIAAKRASRSECVLRKSPMGTPGAVLTAHKPAVDHENNLRQCGYNSLGGLISCEECIAKDADAQTGYELISDLCSSYTLEDCLGEVQIGDGGARSNQCQHVHHFHL